MLPSWQALAGGDTVNARRLIGPELVRQASSDAIPAPDVLLQYSLLALAVRDTAAAMAVLDRVINTLPELDPELRVMSDSIGAGRPGPRTSADGSQRASPPVSH